MEYEFVFQPIVPIGTNPDTTDGAAVGWEALARTNKSRNAAPAVLDERQVTLSLASYTSPHSELWVNIPPSLFTDPEIVGLFAGRIQVVELTEQHTSTPHKTLADAARRWRDAGVLIASDDYGDGGSQRTAAAVQPDFVKIRAGDPDFAVLTEQASTDFPAAVLVAEAVETAAVRDTAAAAGCTLGQGWFWGRPIDPLALTAPFVDLTVVDEAA